MLDNVSDLKVGDKVIVEGYPYENVEVIESPARTNSNFVKCKIVHDGIIKENIFLPKELSFLIVLDAKSNKHLILLEDLLHNALTQSDYISLHYYPNDENKFFGYCFDTGTVPDPQFGTMTKGFDTGIGMHIHWLKMWYSDEITNFLGNTFFSGRGIRLRKTESPNKNRFIMEYWL